jgi:hypothetical protein
VINVFLMIELLINYGITVSGDCVTHSTEALTAARCICGVGAPVGSSLLQLSQVPTAVVDSIMHLWHHSTGS